MLYFAMIFGLGYKRFSVKVDGTSQARYNPSTMIVIHKYKEADIMVVLTSLFVINNDESQGPC